MTASQPAQCCCQHATILTFIPVVGFILLLALGIIPGTPGVNNLGLHL